MNFHRPKRPKVDTSNMLFGINPVLEAIESGREIEKIFFQKGLKSKFSEILDHAHKFDIPYSEVPIQKLNGFTGKQHQGIVVFTALIQYSSIDHIIDNAFDAGKEPFIMALDGVSDVRNFGAISRSAEALGIDGIVISGKGGAMINADAIKTSSGALNHIAVSRESNLFEAIAYIKNRGLRVIIANEKSEKELQDVELKGPLCIVMGAEDKGVSTPIQKIADEVVRIPLSGKVESLNVSVASGIMIYEAIRQRLK